jgi:hypothetical protein
MIGNGLIAIGILVELLMLVEVTMFILHCHYFAKLIQYGQMFRLQCDCWLNSSVMMMSNCDVNIV